MKAVAIIEKTLSRNDSGENQTHQAGILVPKRREMLSFFPLLDKTILNPRKEILVLDEEGIVWKFAFIYYNNRLFGTGTRNEYRLTCMTRFIHKYGYKAGDTLILKKYDDGTYGICGRRGMKSDISVSSVTAVTEKTRCGHAGSTNGDTEGTPGDSKDEVLIISGGWKCIKIKVK